MAIYRSRVTRSRCNIDINAIALPTLYRTKQLTVDINPAKFKLKPMVRIAPVIKSKMARLRRIIYVVVLSPGSIKMTKIVAIFPRTIIGPMME